MVEPKNDNGIDFNPTCLASVPSKIGPQSGLYLRMIENAFDGGTQLKWMAFVLKGTDALQSLSL